MQLSTLLGSTCLLALVPWTLRPAAIPQEPTPGRLTYADRMKLARENFQGTWQLIRATRQGRVMSGPEAAGYMLVQPDHLAMEVHLMMPSRIANNRDEAYFQTRIGRWRLATETQLQISALIGTSNINERERWVFEPPGNKRDLVVAITANTAFLEWPGESRLEFRKIATLPFPGDPLPLEPDQGERDEKRDGAADGD